MRNIKQTRNKAAVIT